jgi:O-antigen ligase
MWREVLPEVPKYLFLGKGYSIDPVDLYLTEQASQSGLLSNYETSIIAGDYHNGPLSVLMPFGLPGAIAVLWLLGAGVKVLYGNMRYGDARLRLINAVLLSYFLAQTIQFFFVVGAISSQLVAFMGILGLSVSFNGGVCRKPAVARQTAPSSPLAAPMAVA